MPTELFHQVTSPDALQQAWARVQTGGRAPGLDGITLDAFSWRAERELARLRSDLRDGTYRPWPARRVLLPKEGGGARAIGIQAVRDRVAQRALMARLQPRVEPTLEDCSYAFRPRRSVEMALTHLEGLRAGGYPWVVRADVTLCFDSLDRRLLEECLRPVLPEPDARNLVHLWLTAGAVDETDWAEPGVGVPQGDVLSPLLCNLYLDAFDEAVTGAGHPLVRYADDFVILGRSEAQARRGLVRAEGALASLGLGLNPSKQWVGTFAQGFTYLGAAIVGSLRLPLHRVEHPGRPPRYEFGYEAAGPRTVLAPKPPALVTTERALRDRMVALLRAERAGRELPPLAGALLRAWQEAGALPPERGPRPAELWQSVYLI